MTFAPTTPYIVTATGDDRHHDFDKWLLRIELRTGRHKRLTDTGAHAPTFSPDGARIAYLVSSASGDIGVPWTMEADGTHKRPVPGVRPGDDCGPAIWLSSRTLVFEADAGESSARLVVAGRNNSHRDVVSEIDAGRMGRLDGKSTRGRTTDRYAKRYAVALPESQMTRGSSMPNAVKMIFERDTELWALPSTGPAFRVAREGRRPAFTPDGQQFIFLKGRTLFLASLDRLDHAAPFATLPADAVLIDPLVGALFEPTLAIHPGGKFAAVGLFRPYRLQMATAAAQPSTEDLLGWIYTCPIPQNSQRPAASALDSLEEWITPNSRGLGSKGTLSASHPSWSADGRRLAFARGGSVSITTIDALSYVGGRPEISWSETTLSGIVVEGGGSDDSENIGVGSTSISPDGRHIAWWCRALERLVDALCRYLSSSRHERRDTH